MTIAKRFLIAQDRVLTNTPVIYVNSVSGNNSNDGLLPSAAKLTLGAAISALPGGSGTLRITAPSSSPLQGFITFSSGDIKLEGLNHVPWYAERTQTFTSGWTSVGGGVYSRSAAAATYLYAPTLLDSNGFATILTRNVSTPTTPAAGQFGGDGVTLYVHLPGDANPNSHTIKRPQTSFLFRAAGTASLEMRDCIGRYNDTGGIFENTSSTALLYLKDCLAQYSGNGVVGGGGDLFAVRCTAQRCLNDGFNHNARVMELLNCEGSYNVDEGASNHSGSTMTIRGGRYHHNFAGGCTVVNNSSKMHLTDVLVDFNGAKNQGGIEKNGINFDTNTSGTVTNCVASNNTGSGFYCNSASVVITNLTSGLAQGNTLADDPC